jgi:hypothetical protein
MIPLNRISTKLKRIVADKRASLLMPEHRRKMFDNAGRTGSTVDLLQDLRQVLGVSQRRRQRLPLHLLVRIYKTVYIRNL